MKSWKTTIGGVMAGVAAALALVPDDAPGAKYAKPWAGFIGALGTVLVGVFARDNNVSSEQVGLNQANENKSNP